MADKKTILIIGAGYNQLNLIKSAKELGYSTVVIDISDDAPGKEYSDFFYVLPSSDYDTHCEIIKKHNVRGIVTTQMEKPLLFMAKLAEKYKFNFPSVEAVMNARNKFLMKTRFKEAGVSCADGILIHNKVELEKHFKEFKKYPVMLKPVDAFSSRGVYKAENYFDLTERYEITREFSTDGTVIVEEYLPGKVISVEGYINKGDVKIIQFTDRCGFTAAPFFVELGHLQPAELTSDQKKSVTETLFKALESLKLDNCGFHAEMKVNGKDSYMIEVGARLGGDFNGSHLVECSTGVNIEKIIAAIAMNDSFDVHKSVNQYSMVKWIEFPVGKKPKQIKELHLSSEMLKNIIEYKILLKVGEEIPQITDSSKRRAYVIAKGKTQDEMEKSCKELEKVILEAIVYY